MSNRGEFSSKFAFIMAASGSAIGLGNIWSFPVQVASNGGGAFVFVYIILTFLLAYPVLMAELTIGRYARANAVRSMQLISSPKMKPLAYLTAYWGIVTASLILSFYSIVAGWMFGHFIASLLKLFNFTELADWLTTFSIQRNLTLCLIFSMINAYVISQGVSKGIERFSVRLMPILFLLIVALVIYIATLEGAAAGWKAYLVPDFSQVLKPSLLLNALGQAFFSLSLGVGTMMIYGSYISKKENLAMLGAGVVLMDVGIAILAGMLIIPAMYVASANGVDIYNQANELIDSDSLIFTVLPALFSSIGTVGTVVSIIFFLLMTIAALTSSISMLEVPVSYAEEKYKIKRTKASWLVAMLITFLSFAIIVNFDLLFGFVIIGTTKYSQPLIGLLYCIFVGWVWNRNTVLKELKQGNIDVETSLFWKIWPIYIQYICPTLIFVLIWQYWA